MATTQHDIIFLIKTQLSKQDDYKRKIDELSGFRNTVFKVAEDMARVGKDGLAYKALFGTGSKASKDIFKDLVSRGIDMPDIAKLMGSKPLIDIEELKKLGGVTDIGKELFLHTKEAATEAFADMPLELQRTLHSLVGAELGVEELSKGLGRKLSPSIFKTAQQLAKTTPVLKKVNSLMFGLLFGGMAMTRAFQGAFGKFEEMTGVFDLFNTALAVSLFAFEPLLDFMIGISEFILDLPDWAQAGLGAFMVIFTILGGILAFVGQFGLTLGSVITWITATLVPGIIGAFTAIGAFLAPVWAGIAAGATALFQGILAVIGGITAPIALIIAAIVLLVIGFVTAWKSNFMGIRQSVEQIWTGIKEIFQGGFDFLKGIVDLIIGIITLDWNKIKPAWDLIGKGIQEIFTGVGDFLKGTFDTIVKSIASLVNTLWNLIPAPIRNWIEKQWGAFSSAIGGFLGITPSVPGMAAGGIVTGPTLAMVGEKGPEAVIPLNQGGSVAGSNITISNYFNNSINSSVDIRDMAKQVEDSIFENLRNRLPSRV
jgi:phage-related protein